MNLFSLLSAHSFLPMAFHSPRSIRVWNRRWNPREASPLRRRYFLGTMSKVVGLVKNPRSHPNILCISKLGLGSTSSASQAVLINHPLLRFLTDITASLSRFIAYFITPFYANEKVYPVFKRTDPHYHTSLLRGGIRKPLLASFRETESTLPDHTRSPANHYPRLNITTY